jgi:EAL domain-containing protein (putative c-di-GMP-specific phosphodiesterase class I)
VNLELKAGVCVVDVPLSATSAIDRAKIACDSTKGKFDLVLRTFDGKLEHRILASDHIVKSLDTAIKKGYIQPYYQPIVRSFTGKVCSIEALSRWIDPDRGLLSPADVIPTLEDRHLIHHHDVHIVRCVCRDLRAMMDANMPVVPVSVNLSRLDFQLCDIFDAVERAIEEFDIPRSLLDIEVTESTLDTSNAFFRPQIERFRAAGHEIWMDDFGSGYSSLNLLKDYDFDVLKIDMAFLYGLESNHNSQEIVSSVVDMAKRLGIRTLAEGVETDAQREFLRGIGCEMVQGYLFSRPVPFSSLAHGLSLGFESLENREYYESVGRVNLLSQQPDEALRPLGGDAVGRGMPLAVVEWDGRSCHYFLANEAYQRNLCRLGFARTEDAAKTLSRNAAMLSALEVMAHGPANSRDEMLVRYTVNGLERTTMVQFVARCDRGAAFLVRPQSMIA